MSRSISISYRAGAGGQGIPIEVQPPYSLLGTQDTSMRFWSLPRLKEIGITRLSRLGVSDPVYFVGWDMMADLRREIVLLGENLESIDFYPEIKAQWLCHLTYCYHLLVQKAPKDSTPWFEIG
jgi:hypothetical protein